MLTFDPVAHVYTLDGERLPGVTDVLKASGLIDFSQIPGDVLVRARDRGSRVHAAIHYLNEGDLDWSTVEDEDRSRIQAWQRFVERRRFDILKAEFRVFSRRHRFAGTADAVGLLDGSLALVDFKCGNPEDVAADLQTAAYAGALLEMLPEPDMGWLRERVTAGASLKRFAVRLQASGEPKVETYPDPRDYSSFLTLLSARRVVEARRGEFEAWLGAA